jgi:hypothetical protein
MTRNVRRDYIPAFNLFSKMRRRKGQNPTLQPFGFKLFSRYWLPTHSYKAEAMLQG